MSSSQSVPKRPLYKSLYVQVLTAVAIGVLLGHFYPQVGADMKPLGDGFIKTDQDDHCPDHLLYVVIGIAGMKDMKKVGKTGGLALLYFEVVSSLALIVGLVIVNLVEPGAGMNVNVATLGTKSIAAYTGSGKMEGTVDFLLNVIPTSVVDAFAKGEILQVLLFSVLFGFALHRFGGRGTMVFDFIEKTSHVLFDIVGIIMKVAPVGAFGAMAFTIGKYGIGSLFSLGKLMGTFYLTCLIFVFVVLGIDRFMSEARALTNLVGNGVATIVVAKWTGELDTKRLEAGLNNESWIEAEAPEVLLDQKVAHMAGAKK
ncbi:cation:dicarboxylase symporter family transporter [Rhodoferax sp.]|uniref:cation:dicarboxylate symporter family transporter n=1 Tax=Rhodoferax sp. TaxID=50421 RepID=UPI001EB15173|nr:cation:dicarboxylase symporter family transporter [Rhodoferax sp.]MBT9506591.1 cation:dicarboxylase symporter family transporter [Rhodoferax sp.]